MSIPPEYYDYNYDIGTLTEVPPQNPYKRKNNLYGRYVDKCVDAATSSHSDHNQTYRSNDSY